MKNDSRILILGTVLSLGSCISSTPKFGGTTGSQEDLYQAKTPIQDVPCFQETTNKVKVVKGPLLPSQWGFRLAHVCSDRQEITEAKTELNPIHLMLVLDITASMQPSLDAIKNGVVQLSRALIAEKWEAKFAAVGFRDEGQMQMIPFSDAETFYGALGQSKWQASGGDDYQEAGQEALLAGFQALKAQAESSKSKDAKPSQNILLYVSNAPAYIPGDRKNFQTADLAAKTQALSAGIPSFRFFYAADSRFLPSGVENTMQAPMPIDQMRGFAKQVTFASKEMSYPISTEALLGEFSKGFQVVTSYRQLTCFLQTATMASKEGQGIPGNDRLTDIAGKAEKGEPVYFQLSPDPETRKYDLTIERCCKFQKDEAGCTLNKVTTVFWNFEK